MAETVVYPTLPALGTDPAQRTTEASNVAPSRAEGGVGTSVAPTQRKLTGGQPAGEATQSREKEQELPATSGPSTEDVKRATADSEQRMPLKVALAAKYSQLKADMKVGKNGDQAEYTDDNDNFAPNGEGDDSPLEDDKDAAARDLAKREALLNAGAANAVTQATAKRPRDVDLLWTQCYPAVRSWWSGSFAMGTLKKIDEVNRTIAKKNEKEKRKAHEYRVPKEEWMTEIQSAVTRLEEIETGGTGPERADHIVRLVDQLMTWKHKLDKLGLNHRRLIPGDKMRTILGLVSSEPKATKRYDELFRMYCEPSSEQLVHLQREERMKMMETLFQGSHSIKDKERALEGLVRCNDELAKLNQELGLQVFDHTFSGAGGRALLVALEQNDQTTASDLTSQIKAFLMLQGDPLHRLIGVDVSEAVVEKVKESDITRLIASAENLPTIASADPSVSPTTSRGDKMDVDSLFVGDETEAGETETVPKGVASADGPAGATLKDAAAATGVPSGKTSAGRAANTGPKSANATPVPAAKRKGLYEMMLHIEAEGPWACKLVKASQFGKETVKKYEEARREQGLEPVVFEQTACDLKKMSWDDLFGLGAGILTLTVVQRDVGARRVYVNQPVTYLHILARDGSKLIFSRSRLGGMFGQGNVDREIDAFKAEFLAQPSVASKRAEGRSDSRSKVRQREVKGSKASVGDAEDEVA